MYSHFQDYNIHFHKKWHINSVSKIYSLNMAPINQVQCWGDTC